MKPRQGEPSRHIVDILFVLALFGVFAASALMLVTLGANVYRQTTANMTEHFTKRTAYAYLTEKLRQNDTRNAVSTEELEGIPALVLTQQTDGEEYCTYLYFYEGYLKELSIRKDSYTGADLLKAGQDILELSGFSMEETKDGLLKLTLDTGDGSPLILYASLRSDYD